MLKVPWPGPPGATGAPMSRVRIAPVSRKASKKGAKKKGSEGRRIAGNVRGCGRLRGIVGGCGLLPGVAGFLVCDRGMSSTAFRVGG